ncbi:MAG TPA: hypothetical protein VN253_12265 [Kofleriaceae bacterium]|nr:hypothetical protein [Kofleriaceae bacterium]
MAKPPFQLRADERHAAHSPAAKLHRFGVTTGRLWLTSERVVFQPVVPLPFWLIPPLGAVMYLLNRPQRRELALSEIGARGRTSFGRNRNVLVLGTRDLSPDLKVVVDDFDAFTAALAAQPALAISSGASSPAGAPDAPST